MSRLYLIAAAVSVVVLVAGVLWSQQDEPPIAASLELADAMGGDTTGYARAEAIRPFRFPDDHGPHPAFKTEWWYFTGNLDAAAGQHFGYQFTLFRIALSPQDTAASPTDSDWSTDQIYMGHFTLTDVASEQFYDFERFSRAAAGLAGAQASPFRVWLDDWSVQAADSTAFPMQLSARQENIGIDIRLDPAKPRVLQGDRGLDQKGPEAGNASYYYAYTRLATTGTITVDGETYDVEGLSWMDREWSTSALSADAVGWDWFSLQLADGRDLMYYQLRRADGSPSPESDGALIAQDGTRQALDASEVRLDVLDTWQSPLGDAEYPSRWRLRIPSEGLDLNITPYLPDQELDAAVRYWEGAVRVEGTANGEPVTATGYVELTGYTEGRAGKTPLGG